ncbi:zinc finger protein 70 [Hippoglossus stenolepis]|uniref:zinc finger protein 70 n=1 Tax=Hippoglossus stenolepis TaxID=195615 RepID=UPI001FAF7909|nr:zinc finger protein 70 [Hippoglossus stenolepis]
MNASRFKLKSFLHQRLFLAGEEIVGEMERTITSARPVAGVSRSTGGVEGVGHRRVAAVATARPLTSSTTEPGVQCDPPLMQQNPGPSQTSAGLDCKDWNISPEDTDLKISQIKEEPGDESQTQEIVFPSPEIMKSEQDQPEIQVSHEMQPGPWNCSAVKTENNDRDEELVDSQAVLPNKKLSTKNLKDRKVCHWCGKSFKRICGLTNHIKRHKALTYCDVCGTEFKSTKLLVLHLKHFHKNTCFCEVCGNTFSNGRFLEIHERMHTDMKEFPCQECGKTFNSSDHLVDHVRTHTWETPYQCDICGKAFLQSQDLTVHKESHSDKMPHSCSLCGKRFNKRSRLKSHMKRHSGENPYPCDICDKRFSQGGKLRTHRTTHKRRFACQVCGKRYKSTKRVEVHLRSHDLSDAE